MRPRNRLRDGLRRAGLAAVLAIAWPAWAALSCLGVAAAYAVENQLQATSSAVPRELAPLLPYVLTLLKP